jgi:3-phosphoshikimate 1-carboxyvinyltransferase
MLQAMDVVIDQDGRTVTLRGGQTPTAVDVSVPADLSSAAFLLVAAIISDNGEVTVPNVGMNPTRTGALEILRDMGASVEASNQRMLGREPVADLTARASSLRGLDVDPRLVSLSIDEFPLLFVAAAYAEGKTRFSEIGELRVKESDRIGAMARGLRNLGIDVTESEDSATVHGGQPTAGTVDSNGDHRIAMAFAVAGTRASGPVTVRESDAVDTSFPGFAQCLRACGARLDEHGRA